MAHPIRIRISFRPATTEETDRALRIKPAEKRAAEALVKRLLEAQRKVRRKKARATATSAKSA